MTPTLSQLNARRLAKLAGPPAAMQDAFGIALVAMEHDG